MLEAADHGDAPGGPAASGQAWPPVMTKSAYGQYRRATTGRGSAPMVTKYIRDGKITAPALRPDGKIDRRLADAQLARTLDMSQRGGEGQERPPLAPTIPLPDPDAEDEPTPEEQSSTLAAEQAALQRVRRRKVELEIAQIEGRLVDRAEAKRETVDIFRLVRDRVTALSGRIAAHLVGRDEREIATMMRKETDDVFREVASLLRSGDIGDDTD